MTLGAVLRNAREKRRLTITRVAELTGLSASFITRVECDSANPTWRTVQRVADALECEPVLRLVPDESAIAGAQALIAHATPMQRLVRQPVNTLGALDWLVAFRVPFVVTGAAAALVQGFPTPVHDLHVLVRDDNDALEAVAELLLRQQMLFDEVPPDELREIVERTWLIDETEVRMTLVAELPSSNRVNLGGELEVNVLTPDALLDDPEVAATLRISRMGSSDL